MPPPDDKSRSSPKPSGRVRHDSGGRAVWEWAKESGRHAIESTSTLLKRLDLPGLRLSDDTEIKKREREKDEERATQPYGKTPPPTFGGSREADPLANSRQSFNPYDNRVPKRGAPPPRKPVPPAKPRITQPPREAKKPGFFSRLFGGK